MRNKDFVATSDAPKESLLLGPHPWKIYNDSKKCSNNKTYFKIMTMMACGDEEFTCDDGSCVSMEERCDGKSHCFDSSDEKECYRILPKAGYDKFLIPPPLKDKNVLEVKFSVQIQNILEIDEMMEIFNVKIKVFREWYDTRLTYMNLKTKSELNRLSPDDVESMWYPWTNFRNIHSYKSYEKTGIVDIWQIMTNDTYSYEVRDEAI